MVWVLVLGSFAGGLIVELAGGVVVLYKKQELDRLW